MEVQDEAGGAVERLGVFAVLREDEVGVARGVVARAVGEAGRPCELASRAPMGSGGAAPSDRSG